MGIYRDKTIASEETVSAIIGVLRDEDDQVRKEAAWALGEMGEKGKKAIDPLREALKKEKNKETKFQIADSLARLEGTKKSKGIKVMQEMEKRRELEEQQKERFDELCQELGIEESLEKATEGVKGVRESIERDESKTETLAKVEALGKEIQTLKDSFEKIKEDRTKDKRELEQQIGRTVRDIGAIQEGIETIPQLQVAFKGGELETRIINLETDMKEVKTELKEKKLLINRWVGIGLGISILWAIIITILSLVIAYLDIIKEKKRNNVIINS
ncbi:MAG: hypothetical protein GF308_02935 [Candidatus Heimdallarchaeota archaeon]|nr:hypothetical protein [Candidatus Heimdallarchaeota archaeon]